MPKVARASRPAVEKLYPFASDDDESVAMKAYQNMAEAEPLSPDTFLACLYEYARHLVAGKSLQEEALLLDRHPWDAFAELTEFPNQPYAKLSAQHRAYLKSQIEPQATGGVFQWPAGILQRAGTFEEMSRTIEEASRAMYEGKRKLETLLPRFPADAPYREHVLFTLDYRRGKEIMKADFVHWLETHGAAMIDAHAVTHKGGGLGLFSERLEDLIRWRAAHKHGPKTAATYFPYLNADSYALEFRRAKARAKEFLDFLNRVSFTNLYQLALDWKLHRKPAETVHLKPGD